jgi:hypothetical protein
MPNKDDIREYLLQLLGGGSGDRPLGFHSKRSRARNDYIFVKAEEHGPGCWYRLVGDKTKSTPVYLDPVEESHLTGNLIEVTLVEVPTEKYGMSLKVDLIFDTGEPIMTIVRSGATTFMEGVLRSMMSAPALVNPVTISTMRAEKSDKAVFGEIEDATGLLTIQKGMKRLILWSANDKPRRSEILETFLPAVNNIRVKLGLEPLIGPVDRAAIDKSREHSSEAIVTEVEIVPVGIMDDNDLKAKCFEIIKALGYNQGDGTKVVALMKETTGLPKWSEMKRHQQEALVLALYERIIALNAEPA